MLPPWRKVSVLFPPGSPGSEASQVGLKVKFGPFSSRWILQHQNLSHLGFSDVQIRGPFQSYRHRHHVVPKGESVCVLSEEVSYNPYLFYLTPFIDRELSKLFSWRHFILKEDLKLFARYPRQPLRILVSGTRGLIGSHLKTLLQTAGHQVVSLKRGQQPRQEDAIFWDPSRGALCKEDFEDFDAVIHLAGESIGGLWTSRKKNKLFLSRCRDTWLLSQVLCRLYRPPQTVITASAIGFYGNRGEETLDETSHCGKGFLADLCQKWEQASEVIENRGSRVVRARFGMVLSRKGGALQQMLLPFKLGLGGRLGSGEQILSWIGIDDAMGALYHILMEDSLSGPVNVVAPSPVSQKQFAKILAQKIHRPACVPIPAALLRGIFGEMADAVLLSSARVTPRELMRTGYAFRYPDLQTALDFV
jgi:uncharacterized protein